MSDNITAAMQNQRWEDGKIHRLWTVYVRLDRFGIFYPLVDIHGEATAYRTRSQAKHAASQERRMRGVGKVIVQEVGIVGATPGRLTP